MENNQPAKKQAAPAQPVKKTAAQPTVNPARTARKAGESQAVRKSNPAKPAAAQTAKKTGEGPAVKKAAPAKSAPSQTAKKPAASKPAPAQPKKKKKGSKRRARRIRKIRNYSLCAAALILIAALIFHLTCAFIAGQVYPLSADHIDLKDRGITDARPVARLTGLNEALLSGNNLSDVSPLSALVSCEYIDLTGNPVTPESYAQLKRALPGCLILCEAADNTVTEMALGGCPLPHTDALARVFASHTALRLVDLRGTELSPQEIDSLRAQFPHISFVHSAGAADTIMVNLDAPSGVAGALTRVPADAHVTLTGCAFTPDEYRAVRAQFPSLSLDCMIALGGNTMLISESELSLPGAALDAQLEADLLLFPALDRLTIGEALPTEAARLKSGLGLSELIYTCGGAPVSPETTEIDLRSAAGLNSTELNALISMLPEGCTIMLGAPDAQMLAVISGNQTRCRFIYEVKALGRTFSSADEIIDLGGEVEDEDVEAVRALIEQLPALRELHMYESRLSKESMDLLFDSYPDIFFGWTFRMCKGKYVVRTDVTAFGSELGAPLHTYTQKDFEQLRYCKNLQALDLCHNAITDLEFMRNFPKMKLLILGDNDITDISPLADLKELEFLEMFMNYDLTDYSPLLELENLTDLNVRCPGGKADRLSADDFMGLTSLKRFWASYRHFSKEEEARLREALPDCEICVTKDHSTGDDWRGGGRQEIIERVIKSRSYEPFPE